MEKDKDPKKSDAKKEEKKDKRKGKRKNIICSRKGRVMRELVLTKEATEKRKVIGWIYCPPIVNNDHD